MTVLEHTRYSALRSMAEYVLNIGLSEFIIDLAQNHLKPEVLKAHQWLWLIAVFPEGGDLADLEKKVRAEIHNEYLTGGHNGSHE